GRERVTIHLRRWLEDARSDLLAGRAAALASEELSEAVSRSLAAEAEAGMRRVLNATGIFLHTNLGRAPLPSAVAAGLAPLLDAAVEARELSVLGRERGVPVMVDEGSGLLRRHPAPQLDDHRSMAELLADGCDLVCGSGDKLLGGPQAGLLLGREDLVSRCRT